MIQNPHVGIRDMVSPMKSKFPTFTGRAPDGKSLNSFSLVSGFENFTIASCIVFTCVATTDKTSRSLVVSVYSIIWKVERLRVNGRAT